MRSAETLAIVGVIVAVVALIVVGTLAALGNISWSSVAAIVTISAAALLLVISAGYLIYAGVQRGKEGGEIGAGRGGLSAGRGGLSSSGKGAPETLLSLSDRSGNKQTHFSDRNHEYDTDYHIYDDKEKRGGGMTADRSTDLLQLSDESPGKERETKTERRRKRFPVLTDEQVASLAASVASRAEESDVASRIKDKRVRDAIKRIQKFASAGIDVVERNPRQVDQALQAMRDAGFNVPSQESVERAREMRKHYKTRREEVDRERRQRRRQEEQERRERKEEQERETERETDREEKE